MRTDDASGQARDRRLPRHPARETFRRQTRCDLSVVLAGHPKLKNDLSRPSVEEIGACATVFELEPFGPDRLKYIHWLIAQAVAQKINVDTLITEEALTLLSERLTTPLQFEQYLTRAFEEAYKIGQKPVGTEKLPRAYWRPTSTPWMRA